MEQLQKAIIQNELIQKKNKKEIYTKPGLFVRIESFIKKKNLIGYGGTAINHALPKEAQFYQSSDIPDYDFFSTHAIEDIKELADILYPHVYHIEVKPAVIQGTYKLFVNYLPLVDMTQLEESLFHNLWMDSFQKDGIHYVPYNYLRMSMYQELSRPMGDVSRWTKIFKRLELLNDHRPFIIRKCDVRPTLNVPSSIVKDVTTRLKDYVFLGDYAMYAWQELFPVKYQYDRQGIVFVLAETIQEIWKKLKGLTLRHTFYENKLTKVYEVHVENYPMLYVILADACVNYNVYQDEKIASYDTMLSIYYAMSFENFKHLSKSRLLSYCYLLLQIKEDHPLMRRFEMPCYGHQTTLEELREEREKMYKRNKKSSRFFHYRPKTKKLTSRYSQKRR